MMDRTSNLSLAVLTVALLALAGVALLGDGPLGPSTLETASTGMMADGTPLSGPSVFYTSEVHEKVKDATAKGLAYDVVRGVEVSFTAGDFIHPARPAFIADEPICTFGFVLGSPGSYAITTAGHCVSVGEEVAMPLPEYPAAVVAIGEVVDRENDMEVNDWARIDIKDQFQDNVFPGVFGSPTPQHGAFEVGGLDGDPAAGSVWPMPVMMVSNNPSFGEDSPVPPLVTSVQTPLMGLFVEEHDGAYFCECPVLKGDSGGPVVVFDPEHPEGAALGLVSTHSMRALEFVWEVPGKPGQIESALRDVVFDRSTESLEEMFRSDRGLHELAGITPMPTVVEGAGLPVATVDSPSVGEPCVVKELNNGGDLSACVLDRFNWEDIPELED